MSCLFLNFYSHFVGLHPLVAFWKRWWELSCHIFILLINLTGLRILGRKTFPSELWGYVSTAEFCCWEDDILIPKHVYVNLFFLYGSFYPFTFCFCDYVVIFNSSFLVSESFLCYNIPFLFHRLNIFFYLFEAFVTV